MYEYITGRLVELLPTEAVVENAGFGYSVLISLSTFTKLQNQGEEFVKLYLYHHLREEEEAFFGFFDRDERELFVQLISVSGIGPNSARMMLSSMTADELRSAIIAQDTNKIKSIKGIGLKTAQRVILELKDKVGPGGGSAVSIPIPGAEPSVKEEALSALVLLGFAKPAAEKALNAVLKAEPTVKLEDLIKKALKIL
ncbi:MAG: Holliday junction branch migration protein RuvA [Bacteroidales bacterium]|nr:Holliday junction branch migration protein RuvA [Bacteroidales bacterium]